MLATNGLTAHFISLYGGLETKLAQRFGDLDHILYMAERGLDFETQLTRLSIVHSQTVEPGVYIHITAVRGRKPLAIHRFRLGSQPVHPLEDALFVWGLFFELQTQLGNPVSETEMTTEAMLDYVTAVLEDKSGYHSTIGE